MRKLILISTFAALAVTWCSIGAVPSWAGEANKADRFEQHFAKAQAELKADHFKLAAEQYRLALTLKPRHAQARFELGETYRRWGHYYEARKSYRLAQMLKPADRQWEGRCRIELASCWEAAGLYRQALLEYQLALNADPTLSEAAAASKRMAAAERKQREN